MEMVLISLLYDNINKEIFQTIIYISDDYKKVVIHIYNGINMWIIFL